MPKTKRRRSPIYDRILDKILESPKGNYEIDIFWKNVKSTYQGLSKRIKTDQKYKNKLKLHFLDNKVFIEKL
jgi:hypothetical protein